MKERSNTPNDKLRILFSKDSTEENPSRMDHIFGPQNKPDRKWKKQRLTVKVEC